jgi:hypothetical protein
MDDSAEIDPEDLPQFSIPDSLLEQLFSFTGDGEESKGMILAFVSQNGSPAILSRTSTQVVEMGLRKALEQYLSQMEEVSSSIDLGLNSEDND